MTTETFLSLIKRLREGDELAWSELVRDYGPVILKVARTRLGDKHVTALLDEEDVRQSVLRSLYVRMTDGQYALQEPRQLVALLSVMAKNKAINRLNSEGRRPTSELAPSVAALPSGSPAEIAAHKDSLRMVMQYLTTNEQHLFELRSKGFSWDEIARETGEKSDAVRKRLRRALERTGAAEVLKLAAL